MIINRNTYGKIFVDYLEGELSDSELKILIEFLDQNQDLEEELKDLINYRKSIDTTTLSKNNFLKENLKKENILESNNSNFEELCISFYEGILNENEEEYLLELVENNTKLLLTFDTYGKTTAKSNLSIQYPNKSKLKKRLTVNWFRYTSYAASIIIILSFIFFIQDKKSTEQSNKIPQLAKIEKKYKKFKSEKENNNSVVKESKQPKKNIQTHTAPKQVKKIIKPVEYSNYNKEESTERNSRLISRKGKLAYTSLSELESYLFKLFEKEGIDKVKSAIEIKNKNKIPFNKNKVLNSKFQLATSTDPFKYEKLILGSQPIK